jgi:hypothetical protein
MPKPMPRSLFLLTLLAVAGSLACAAAESSRLVHPGADGRLVYQAWDQEGDTILDYSNCGYGSGGVRIPDVPVKLTLQPVAGEADDTARIQHAIDELAQLPRGADGFRGALLLTRGVYRIGGALRLAASGIVLRGAGQGEDGTVLLATGKKPRNLIEVGGKSGPQPVSGPSRKIADRYVPVGARTFTVAAGAPFKVGDTVLVSRIGNADWIHFIGMDRIVPRNSDPKSTRQWTPFNLEFDRVVTAIEGDRITVDAPLACAIDARWGGGEIRTYADPGRIEQVGVENLRGDSAYDPSVTQVERGQKYFADEAHATQLVSFTNVKNAWARDLTAIHFYHGVSAIGGGAKWVTVQDSAALDPVSIITGGRRYPFSIGGQLNLVQRCYAREARHAFVLGSHVAGPNVFLDGKSEGEHATSEPHHRWSCGGLFDNIRANIAFQDRQWMGSGHGWAGANYVAWNCEGSLVCQQPPTAQNFAIGQVGTKEPGAFKRPDGYWESLGRHVAPRSLYLQQLEDRLGPEAVRRIAR